MKATHVIQNCVPYVYISEGFPNSSIAVINLETQSTLYDIKFQIQYVFTIICYYSIYLIFNKLKALI